jgi:hypothetical protein
MNSEEIKMELKRGMNFLAEYGWNSGRIWKYRIKMSSRYGEMPVFFKPGVADKFLFEESLNRVFENVREEYELHPERNASRFETGKRMINWYYYPNYANWDRREFEEARE